MMKAQTKKDLKLKFRWPNRIEGFLIAGMIFLLFLIDVIQNLIQQNDLDYVVTYLSAGYTVEAIKVIWFATALYIIFFLLVFSRSMWERRATGKTWDLIFGIIGGVGLMFIIAGMIGAFTHSPTEPVSWFYNLPQITFYHIGILMEVVVAFYYAITK